MGTTIVMLLMGLAAGAAVGVYVGYLRERGRSQAELAALGATAGELRGALTAREAEVGALRAALETEKVSAGEARARLESAREHFVEQRKLIEQMQERVRETFKGLSAEALKNNNEQFITLADAKLKPLHEQLGKYEKQIAELEKARSTAYGGLNEKLETLQQRSERLSAEAGNLAAALRQSGAKGRWGEVTLENIVTLAGMSPHCDFVTQQSLESGRRPDLVVRLPGERQIVIDAKVSTSAYLDAAAATDEAERNRHLDRYAASVRTTLKELSAKEYWKQFSSTPEFVVMFVPGESFFAAAVDRDPDLLADGASAKVVLASPTTLIALLMAVRHGWQQQAMAENAQKIAEAGRELYDRLCMFVEHLEGIRAGIAKSAEAYNKAVGNWMSRTLPGAKRLKELGAAESGKALPLLDEADVTLRAAPADESEEGLTRRQAG